MQRWPNNSQTHSNHLHSSHNGETKKPAKKEEIKTMQGYAKNKRNKILGKDER